MLCKLTIFVYATFAVSSFDLRASGRRCFASSAALRVQTCTYRLLICDQAGQYGRDIRPQGLYAGGKIASRLFLLPFSLRVLPHVFLSFRLYLTHSLFYVINVGAYFYLCVSIEIGYRANLNAFVLCAISSSSCRHRLSSRCAFQPCPARSEARPRPSQL